MPSHYFLLPGDSNPDTSALMGADVGAVTIVAQGVLIGNASSVVIGQGALQTVQVQGTITSRSFSAISLEGLGSQIVVSRTGSLHSFEYQSVSRAVVTSGHVLNEGSISGGSGVVLVHRGGGPLTLANHGLIAGQGSFADAAAINAQVLQGVSGQEVQILNTGTIQGGHGKRWPAHRHHLQRQFRAGAAVRHHQHRNRAGPRGAGAP